MIYIIPFFISFIFYIIKPIEIEDNNILNYGMISIIILMNELRYYGSEIIIMLLLMMINYYYIRMWKKDKNKNIISYIFIFSIYFCISCTSLLSFFISVEILSFLVFILINLYIRNKYPGILYYLLSGIFSGLLILSMGYMYMGYKISYYIMNIVFIYKLSLAPFHILLPKIYNNISLNNVLIIDIPYKILLFYLFYRIFIIIDLVPIIILSLLVGSLGALNYRNVLNIMIYSSLYHYGLILIALYFNNWDYFLLYIIIYSLFVLIFLFLITFKFITLNFNNTYYKILWFILIMNLIGIPPLSGFFIKLNCLYLTIFHHFYILFIVASIGIVLLTYTYLRLLLSILIQDKSITLKLPHPSLSHFISSLLIISSFPFYL